MADPTPTPPSIKAAASTAVAAVEADASSLMAKVKPYLYAAGAALAGFVVGHFVK